MCLRTASTSPARAAFQIEIAGGGGGSGWIISATGLTWSGSATGGSGPVSRPQPTTLKATTKLRIFFIFGTTNISAHQK
jgi:hypothetical protein